MSPLNAIRSALAASVGLVVCAASATATSLPFRVRSVDTDALGSPLAITGELFQSAFGSLLPPSPDFIDLIPSIEFDSYVAIDIGPSHPGDPDVQGDGF